MDVQTSFCSMTGYRYSRTWRKITSDSSKGSFLQRCKLARLGTLATHSNPRSLYHCRNPQTQRTSPCRRLFRMLTFSIRIECSPDHQRLAPSSKWIPQTQHNFSSASTLVRTVRLCEAQGDIATPHWSMASLKRITALLINMPSTPLGRSRTLADCLRVESWL